MSDPDRWPDFFIVGAPKAGTTTLFNALSRSDEVCMPTKEPRFFAVGVDHGVFLNPSVTDENSYLGLFADCPAQALAGEASPIYLMDPGAPDAIRARVPDARIIIAVRDPVERAYSHFVYHEARVGRAPRTFEAAIEANVDCTDVRDYDRSYLLLAGMYAEAIARYKAVFGNDSVLVVVFEEMVADVDATLERVSTFLGIGRIRAPQLTDRQKNRAALPRNKLAERLLRSRAIREVATQVLPPRIAVKLGERVLTAPTPKPPMPADARERLKDLYREDAAATEQLLGRRLPWAWLRSA